MFYMMLDMDRNFLSAMYLLTPLVLKSGSQNLKKVKVSHFSFLELIFSKSNDGFGSYLAW